MGVNPRARALLSFGIALPHCSSRINVCGSRRISIILLAFSCGAGGCNSLKKLFQKPPPKIEPIPPTTQVVVEEPIRVATEDRPVKSGSLPLVYLLEFPGEVRVVDATAGVVVIGIRAGGRTILSIDATRGVAIGGRTIRAGPLDPMHTYDIYLISPSENVRKNVYQRR